MLPFFLLYFPWTIRQCSDCCIALVNTAGYCLVYLLVYWLVPPRFPMTWPAYYYCFIEIQPVCISISRSRHEAILFESCLRAKLATLQGFSAAAVIPHLTRGCDEQRERREGEHTQAQWHGAIWTWIIEGEYRFCCFAVFLGVFLVKSPLF